MILFVKRQIFLLILVLILIFSNAWICDSQYSPQFSCSDSSNSFSPNLQVSYETQNNYCSYKNIAILTN